MPFRLFLWWLGHRLTRRSLQDPRLQHCLHGRHLVFQLATRDGRIARHFLVADGRVLALAGAYPHADISLLFRDARCGLHVLRHSNRQLALLGALQDEDIEFRGNPALMLWLQELLDCLDTRPAAASPPDDPLAGRPRNPASQQPR